MDRKEIDDLADERGNFLPMYREYLRMRLMIARYGGIIASFDVLNKCFGISQMPVLPVGILHMEGSTISPREAVFYVDFEPEL